MARVNRDTLDAPVQRKEFALPKGTLYLTWSGRDYVCLTRDRSTTLCGETRPGEDGLLTADPFGKPRCRKCLNAGSIAVVPNEPEVFRGVDETPKIDPSAPPPEFFKSSRRSE